MASQGRFGWFRRHKMWTVIIVLLLLGGIGAAASGGSQNNSSNNSSSESSNMSSSSAAKVAKIGEPARDGKFEFTVKSIECGKTRVGDQYVGKNAQGEFCLLNTTIKNIGNEEQSLFADNQYVYDADGKRYSADSEASIYHDTQGRTWFDEINPGNSVSGAIIFDVPKGTKIVRAELHDSALSGGVKVDLQ